MSLKPKEVEAKAAQASTAVKLATEQKMMGYHDCIDPTHGADQTIERHYKVKRSQPTQGYLDYSLP